MSDNESNTNKCCWSYDPVDGDGQLLKTYSFPCKLIAPDFNICTTNSVSAYIGIQNVTHANIPVWVRCLKFDLWQSRGLCNWPRKFRSILSTTL